MCIRDRLKEVMALCDMVTVMRAGQVAAEVQIADASIEGLAQAMVGRKVMMGRALEPSIHKGQVLLKACLLYTSPLWVPVFAASSQPPPPGGAPARRVRLR